MSWIYEFRSFRELRTILWFSEGAAPTAKLYQELAIQTTQRIPGIVESPFMKMKNKLKYK